MSKWIFCLILLLAIPVKAMASGDIVSMDQSKIRLSIVPGNTAAGVINVENPSDKVKKVRIYLEDWFYLAPYDGTKDFLPAGGGKLSCSDWITFSPAELTLGPYGKQKVNYSVKVPEGAEGGKYAVLFFENAMSDAAVSQGVGVNVSLRLACLFYIESEGTLRMTAETKDLSVIKTPGGIDISLGVSNTGNTDISCKGTFNLMDENGMVQARGEMSDIFTMPGDSATTKGSWSLPLDKGTYDLILTMDMGKAREEAGLGRGPVVVKEARVEIGDAGEVINVDGHK